MNATKSAMVDEHLLRDELMYIEIAEAVGCSEALVDQRAKKLGIDGVSRMQRIKGTRPGPAPLRTPPPSGGFPCPKCSSDTRVYDSRPTRGGRRRRRECDACGHRFTTAEVIYETGALTASALSDAVENAADYVESLGMVREQIDTAIEMLEAAREIAMRPGGSIKTEDAA